MPSRRQAIAAEIVKLMRRTVPCQFRPRGSGGKICGARNYKPVMREQHGIDLQCRACGRFAEGKGYKCRRVPSRAEQQTAKPRRRQIPGGSQAVWERQVAQRQRVDLIVAEYDTSGDVLFRAIRAEKQPRELRTERVVKRGPRAGHRLYDINIGELDGKDFPCVARGRLPAQLVEKLQDESRSSQLIPDGRGSTQ